MYGLVIRGATIIDGTGLAGVRGDVAVDGDRIAAVGRVAPRDAHRTLDADGLTLAPGFIDMHAHSDLMLFEEPEHHRKVRMGVTTELLGQDGLSYAPATPEALIEMRDMVAGINGAPDIEYDWTSVAGYLQRISDARPAVNVAYLVPHGLLRLAVLGMAERVATTQEVERMALMAAAGMRDGALGLSTGLTYPPAKWSDTRELIGICKAVSDYAGIYVTHHRDYAAGLIDAVAEALEIGRAAGVPVHFSHFHMPGEMWRGRAPELLDTLSSARASGQDVSLDAYPYLAGSTFLGAFLPAYAQGGSPDEIVARLQQPEMRRRVIADLDVQPEQWVQASWDVFAISGLGTSSPDHIEGRRIPEIAAARRQSIGEFVTDLLIEQHMQVGVIAHFGNEDNVRTIMGDAHYMVGTDSVIVGSSIHPRASGTYPRVLGTYVREEAVLTLPRAVRAMSGGPADRLGFIDRGYVRVGQRADLVLFDHTTVAGPASYEDPESAPVGLPYVFVNGDAVKWDDEMTDARPGQVIRGTGDGHAA